MPSPHNDTICTCGHTFSWHYESAHRPARCGCSMTGCACTRFVAQDSPEDQLRTLTFDVQNLRMEFENLKSEFASYKDHHP